MCVGVWCWIRKEREGTVRFRGGESGGVMKNFVGRVRWPAERAWRVTVYGVSAILWNCGGCFVCGVCLRCLILD